MLGLISPGIAQEKKEAGWEEVEYRGDPYVTTQSLKDFYRFDTYRTSKGYLYFTKPDMSVVLQYGTKKLLVNNTKFNLSKNIAAKDGNYLISKMDLTKLLDPVLRPHFVRRSAPFQTVVLDAGHGGQDTGSYGLYGNEKTHALRLAKLVKLELERRGIRVKMTRTGDQELSLKERVVYANRINNSIFVSLHFNNGPRSVRGIETYALPPQGAESTLDGPSETDSILLPGNAQDSQNIALATAVHASIMHELKAIDRGIRRARWGVLKGINQPAILLEAGYLTNNTDAERIADISYQKELATAIADGIMKYRSATSK